MRVSVCIALCLAAVACLGGFIENGHARLQAEPNDPGRPPSPQARPDTLQEEIHGGIAFPPSKRMWVRLSGKVTVRDARTLLYEDGTEVTISGLISAPELEQKGTIGGSFYPCGKDAAEFLRKLIGDRSVTCIARSSQLQGKKLSVASAFIGETSLDTEMVRNGWAVSDHEGMDPWEIIARENKRGMWRGRFIAPQRWREGDRLPGE
jgi:endonuclease YncB( thermonuclease family)